MTKTILFSKYNDLSEIYNHENKLININQSPNQYYNAYYNTFRPVIDKQLKQNLLDNYSILGLDNNNNNNDDVARLIKFKSGFIALKIPYLKLITLYKD